MKKRALALVMTFVLAGTLAACGSSSSATSTTASTVASTSTSASTAGDSAASGSDSDKIKIGFSSAAFSDEWCKHLADAFAELAESEYPQFEVTLLDGNIDAEKQINTIESLIQQDMDYIAVQPLQGTEPALLEVNEAEIPLFCVDMVPSNEGLVWTQVGVDEAEFGRLQAEAMAEVLPENGKVCIVMNMLGSNSQIYRTQGFEERIAELRPDVTILDKQTSESKTDKAMNLTEDWIQRFGEDGIDGIVCQSAMSVQGVVESLRAHDLLGKVQVASQDFTQPSGTEWLKSGATCVDVFYDYNALVRGVYDTILAYEAGTELPEQVTIAPTAYTIDNVDEYQG